MQSIITVKSEGCERAIPIQQIRAVTFCIPYNTWRVYVDIGSMAPAQDFDTEAEARKFYNECLSKIERYNMLDKLGAERNRWLDDLLKRMDRCKDLLREHGIEVEE